jgi:hypothetical protein
MAFELRKALEVGRVSGHLISQFRNIKDSDYYTLMLFNWYAGIPRES